MFSFIKPYVFILIGSFLITSCDNTKQEDVDDIENETTESAKIEASSQKISAQNVFSKMPGRQTIISLAQQSLAEYNYAFLNDPNEVNKYTIESSKALNLGAYGADLNVTSVFDQSQESMLFLKCVNTLAKSLGVSNAFDEKMVDRMEKNKQNKDSTLEIVSQSFKNADNYLTINGRPGTSSLIVAGVWIEGLYIACSTAKETNNEGIIKEIFAQKESLLSLIELLENANISEEVKYIISDLGSLKKIIESKTDPAFNLDTLKELDQKTTEIRTKIVSAK